MGAGDLCFGVSRDNFGAHPDQQQDAMILISFFSAGLGVLQLDASCSQDFNLSSLYRRRHPSLTR